MAPDNGFLVRGRIYQRVFRIFTREITHDARLVRPSGMFKRFLDETVGWAQTLADSRAASAVARIRCPRSGPLLRWRQACVRRSIGVRTKARDVGASRGREDAHTISCRTGRGGPASRTRFWRTGRVGRHGLFPSARRSSYLLVTLLHPISRSISGK